MSNKVEITRPNIVAITIYVLSFIGLFGIIYTFTGAFAPYGLLYPAAHTLLIVGIFASFAGIWNMERWGVYVFLVMITLKLVLDILTGAFSFWELALLLPSAIFLIHLKKMK